MTRNSCVVSAIIPVYNRGPFLGAAIESIFAQQHQALEIIIVDDGSTDNTAAVAASFGQKIRYVYQANAGPAAARNHGLKVARGEMIGFLDADDLWTKTKLDVQLARLRVNPPVDLVVGCTQRVRQVKNPDGTLEFQLIPPLWMAFSLGSGLFRRSVFDAVGVFDETLIYGEDVDWFLRAREQEIPIALLKDVSQLYRIHDANMTHDVPTANKFFLQALKKSLDRRKQQTGEPFELALPADFARFCGNWRNTPIHAIKGED